MSTTPLPVRTPRIRQTAAVIRRIGQLRPHTATATLMCGLCSVTWSGGERDCWSCGRPATSEHAHRGAALTLLLQAVTPRQAAA